MWWSIVFSNTEVNHVLFKQRILQIDGGTSLGHVDVKLNIDDNIVGMGELKYFEIAYMIKYG